MIPVQSFRYVGLAFAKAFGWGIGRASAWGIETLDREILQLSRLDEPALLVVIGRRGNRPEVAVGLEALGVGGADLGGDAAGRGSTIVEGLLPWARARICPHRDRILAMVDSPEVAVIRSAAGWLVDGLPGALVAPMATLLVKRGLPLLCGPC